MLWLSEVLQLNNPENFPVQKKKQRLIILQKKVTRLAFNVDLKSQNFRETSLIAFQDDNIACQTREPSLKDILPNISFYQC
jgi:hypothetical protein